MCAMAAICVHPREFLNAPQPALHAKAAGSVCRACSRPPHTSAFPRRSRPSSRFLGMEHLTPRGPPSGTLLARGQPTAAPRPHARRAGTGAARAPNHARPGGRAALVGASSLAAGEGAESTGRRNDRLRAAPPHPRARAHRTMRSRRLQAKVYEPASSSPTGRRARACATLRQGGGAPAASSFARSCCGRRCHAGRHFLRRAAERLKAQLADDEPARRRRALAVRLPSHARRASALRRRARGGGLARAAGGAGRRRDGTAMAGANATAHLRRWHRRRGRLGLQLGGDTPTRAAVYDSIAAGCIPVLFSNASVMTDSLPPPLSFDGALHVPLALFLASPPADIVEVLAAVPDAEVRRRQRRLREWAPDMADPAAAGGERGGARGAWPPRVRRASSVSEYYLCRAKFAAEAAGACRLTAEGLAAPNRAHACAASACAAALDSWTLSAWRISWAAASSTSISASPAVVFSTTTDALAAAPRRNALSSAEATASHWWAAALVFSARPILTSLAACARPHVPPTHSRLRSAADRSRPSAHVSLQLVAAAGTARRRRRRRGRGASARDRRARPRRATRAASRPPQHRAVARQVLAQHVPHGEQERYDELAVAGSKARRFGEHHGPQ